MEILQLLLNPEPDDPLVPDIARVSILLHK